jgi:hypothetical protein
MLANQTVGVNNRRALRTNTDPLLSMKKTKKQQEDLSHRRKLRSSNTDSTENKSRQRQTIPLKKERKKRMKKINHNSEQEVIITQSIEARKTTSKIIP